MDEDVLEHYGIKRMKWGVRRYQYKDGTLTPAGRERYSKGLSKHYRKASQEGERRHAVADAASKSVSELEFKNRQISYKQAKAERKNPDSKKTAKLTQQQKDVEAVLAIMRSRAYAALKDSEKWDSAMADAFRNVNVKNISEEDLAIGKRYVSMLINDEKKD